ncbi:MAG: polysaccharide biosynthesis protein [Egibacteraceae bacterium]
MKLNPGKPRRPVSAWRLRLALAATRARCGLPLLVLDAALVSCAYLIVLLARFAEDGMVPASYWAGFRRFLPIALAAHLCAHAAWRLYGQMWRHASVKEARRVVLASATAGTLGAVWFWGHRDIVPATVLLLGPVLTTMAVGGLRFQSRIFAFRPVTSRQATRLVVIGAGESGAAVIRDLSRTPDSELVPVAVLDDDPRKHHLSLCGVPIIGGIDQLPVAVERFRAEQALLAIPSASSELVRQVALVVDAVGLPLKVLPSVRELVDGQISHRDVRDLSIDDLLGRQQVQTDLEAVERILTGRRVLITGAGGSIGSEIARQVAQFGPSSLMLLDHDETHLFEAAASVGPDCVQVLADIKDRSHIHKLMVRHRPEVIFHAAAHKHVPLLEDHPCEAVTTNVLGTMNVVEAAVQVGVERLVFVSTDKAVRPSSVMGASKRLGEQILLARAPQGSRYCAVRFGNVLGSRGSVIPTFMRQIAGGGPVTVTDPRMTRFFMSIPEAVQLVLQAAALAKGGEIFMLEMGEPVRILDLAERMIRLSGRQVGIDVPIRVVGTRPGEKLAEELHAPDEATIPTPHPAVLEVRPVPLDVGMLDASLTRLVELAHRHDDTAAAVALFAIAGDGAGHTRPDDGQDADPTRLVFDLIAPVLWGQADGSGTR